MVFKGKRLLAILMIFILSVSMLPMTVLADTEIVTIDTVPYLGYKEPVNPKLRSVSLEAQVDVKKLKASLVEQCMSCPERIDVSEFKIIATEQNIHALIEYIYYEVPELFHIDGFESSYYRNRYDNTIVSILPRYRDWADTATKYQKQYAQFVANAEILLDGIEGNSDLNDLEKALLLHDRLAEWNEYDYDFADQSYTGYGAFVNQTSVCQGYAMAYMYMLERVGIESDFCSSEALCHAWNIVYIDDVPYHVDVTHDDGFNLEGRVAHKNFLLSSDAYMDNNHEASDFTFHTTDTTYDNYFWQNSTTGFQLVNNEIYYIDNSSETLSNYDYGTYDLLAIDDGNYWNMYYPRYPYSQACLDATETELLYTTPVAVYAYDPITGEHTKVFSPSGVGGRNKIYGFEYQEGYLICYLSSNMEEYTIEKKLYDKYAPSASIVSTNNVAPSQEVTFTMNDNYGIQGFYWGMDSNYENNSYISTSATTYSVTVSDEGTYYLTVEDIAGNLTTEEVTFYRTTLDANGGSVYPSSVLTKAGDTFILPSATLDGYICEGWSTDPYALDGNKRLTPTDNNTYYAIYDVEISMPYVDVTEADANYSWFGEAIGTMYKNHLMNGYDATHFAPYGQITRADFALTLYRIAGQPEVEYTNKFADVNATDYYASAVAWASGTGVVNGMGNRKFCPNDKISRQDMIVMMYRYCNSPKDQATGDLSQFKDASSVYGYAVDALKWGTSQQLIKGNADGGLAPKKNITRAEIAVILDRFLG